MINEFGKILELLFAKTQKKYGGGEAAAQFTDRDGVEYFVQRLKTVPGVNLIAPFPAILVMVLEKRSLRTQKLYLMNGHPWKTERGDELVIPPYVLLRLELDIGREEAGDRKYERRELQAYIPGTGPFRGLDLMHHSLASARVAIELIDTAHELARGFDWSVELGIKAA
jgi:hypothetical protein